MDENVKRFASLFRGFDKRHGRFEITGRKDSGKLEGRASTVETEPTIGDYEAHTRGEYGIGIIPLTEDNRINFASIDVDKYDIDAVEVACRVQHMPLVVTESKSKGVHLWLFVAGGAPASLAVKALKLWAGQLGFGGCEIFPKQTERSGPKDVGNWINLPYFGESRRCVLPDGTRLDFDQFLEHVYGNADTDTPGHRVNAQWLEDEAFKTEVENDAARDKDGNKKEDFEDGPPCFQAILKNGLGEGSRNTCFFNFGVYLLRKYGDPDQVKRKLYAVDEAHSIGLPNSEIDRTMHQVQKKDYGYQCSQSPLKDYCQRGKCRRRSFGVGQNSGAADYPAEIGGMTMILSEPPMWAFNVDGKRVLAKDSNQILNQHNFRKLVMDASKKVVPVLAQDRFDQMVQSWIEHADEVEVPMDLTPVVLVLSALAEYVQERKNSEKDRIASGSVWIDETDTAHFKASDFKNYLKANKIDSDDREVVHKLHESYGLKQRNTTVSGKSMRLWSISMKFLEVPSEIMEQPTQDVPF